MLFLANENMPLTAVHRLRNLGHDVLSALESMAGSGDPAVLARAVAEQRAVLTFDKDFGELAFRSRLPASCGVVLFRFTRRGRENDITRIVNTLQSRTDWPGAFWTITDQRIRRRPLPDVGSA